MIKKNNMDNILEDLDLDLELNLSKLRFRSRKEYNDSFRGYNDGYLLVSNQIAKLDEKRIETYKYHERYT